MQAAEKDARDPSDWADARIHRIIPLLSTTLENQPNTNSNHNSKLNKPSLLSIELIPTPLFGLTTLQ
jgi:hypothetical protein